MTKRRTVTPPEWEEQEKPTCPLCGRLMPDRSWNEHHLVPATFKGREKVAMHKICHDTLHRTFSEREMEKYYNTIPRLLENEDIRKFVGWVQKKPNDFYSKSKETKDRKRNRR